MMCSCRGPLQKFSLAPPSFPRKRESSYGYSQTSKSVSFPKALIGNPGETRTGPPIETFGGDDAKRNSDRPFLRDHCLLLGRSLLRVPTCPGNHKLVAIFFSLFFLWASPLFAHDDRPIALRSVDLEQKLGAQVPLDVEFRDEAGKTVSLKEYFGRRPVILSLVYYSCQDLCPLVLDGLVRSLRPLSFPIGDQFDVITLSFDPRDTPALAAAKKSDSVKQYSRPGAGDGWHFLTGDENAIRRLTEAVGFRYNYESDKDRFGHATGIILLTPDGKIARYFYGIEFSPRDLRLGLIEASANQIGSPIDQLLLFCYHYDPSTGKYSLLVTNIVRIGGVVTVIALAAFIIVMLSRERGRKLQPRGSAEA
jgi:protein SCO1